MPLSVTVKSQKSPSRAAAMRMRGGASERYLIAFSMRRANNRSSWAAIAAHSGQRIMDDFGAGFGDSGGKGGDDTGDDRIGVDGGESIGRLATLA